MIMTDYQQLIDLISDPILGPFEGEDFSIDHDGIIQVADNDVKTAALLMRKANSSGQFPQNLVKVGQRGDSILLGFDTLATADAVYMDQIGFKGDVRAEVKSDIAGKFYVYFDGKRVTKQFAKLTAAKSFIKKMDKAMQSMGEMIVTADDDLED